MGQTQHEKNILKMLLAYEVHTMLSTWLEDAMQSTGSPWYNPTSVARVIARMEKTPVGALTECMGNCCWWPSRSSAESWAKGSIALLRVDGSQPPDSIHHYWAETSYDGEANFVVPSIPAQWCTSLEHHRFVKIVLK